MSGLARCVALVGAIFLVAATGAEAQEELIVRPPPPALEDFETDRNKDGLPDGWYNPRDVKVVAEGGKVGPHYLRFESRKPGRPARLSRAFGIDGRKHEALILGFWLRIDQIEVGERLGDEPALLIEFLGEGLRTLRRGTMGPWTRTVGMRWTRVAKRISVPPGARDALMSIGLLGGTGIMEVDGLTIDLVPVGGTETTNLVNNSDFELGDPAPPGWILNGGAHRSFPGFQSNSAVELPKSGAQAMSGLAVPVEPFSRLSVSMMVSGQGLRGAGGAGANLFFLDANGQLLRGLERGVDLFRWAGSFEWRQSRLVVPVPEGAVRAVLQVEKSDSIGTIHFDDVSVTAAPNPNAGAWTPYHVETDTQGWASVQPSTAIKPGSALDASYLLEAPAGKRGFVTVNVRDGRLAFTKGGRARFFGVYLHPPASFQEPDRADALADRLARSGVNLVRLADLDTPLGPDRSLFEDSRDDTQAFDEIALAKLDHLIAALKARGIYVSLELLSSRRFRQGDGVAVPGALPLGGGPAAEFDPVIRKLALETARALLSHVNPETGLALRDDPVLAWVTLAGEVSLFDQIDNPNSLPGHYADELRELSSKSGSVGGRRFWQSLGEEHWAGMADALRKDRLRVPIAGVSHWRRDAEFAAVQAKKGLDLIDDRLYWIPHPWIAPDRRSLLWSQDGALASGASQKRRTDRPFVVSQWCDQTMGAWALPYEAADVMLASTIAATEDWDALVRRAVYVNPTPWGSAAAGTGGHEDIHLLPEIVNGMPQVYALWPHASSILLRSPIPKGPPPANLRPSVRPRNLNIAGWEPDRGRLVIDTPFTQGLAGWPNDEPGAFEHLLIETDAPYAVVVASSASREPIASTKRLLVTAVARIEPTGLRWVDEWRRDVAEPGRPPLLQEPVKAKVLWRRKGNVKAYALDNNGARGPAVKLDVTADGVQFVLDGSTGTMHWELVVE